MFYDDNRRYSNRTRFVLSEGYFHQLGMSDVDHKSVRLDMDEKYLDRDRAVVYINSDRDPDSAVYSETAVAWAYLLFFIG